MADATEQGDEFDEYMEGGESYGGEEGGEGEGEGEGEGGVGEDLNTMRERMEKDKALHDVEMAKLDEASSKLATTPGGTAQAKPEGVMTSVDDHSM